MKKNWFQILSLALNAVLLIALLMTRAELVDTQTILKSQLDGIAWRLSDMDERITNLSAKQRDGGHGGDAGGDPERPDHGAAYVRERRRVHRPGELAGGTDRRSVLRGEYHRRRSDQPGGGHQLQ